MGLLYEITASLRRALHMKERPRPLRLGVIGAGWFASRRHCPDVADHPEAELVALCRRDEEQLAQMRGPLP